MFLRCKMGSCGRRGRRGESLQSATSGASARRPPSLRRRRIKLPARLSSTEIGEQTLAGMLSACFRRCRGPVPCAPVSVSPSSVSPPRWRQVAAPTAATSTSSRLPPSATAAGPTSSANGGVTVLVATCASVAPLLRRARRAARRPLGPLSRQSPTPPSPRRTGSRHRPTRRLRWPRHPVSPPSLQ